MDNLYIILLLILIGYFALYFGGRKYLETFKGHEGRQEGLESRPESLQNQPRLEPHQQPQIKPEMQYPSELNKDTYELAQVFNNQGSKTASKKQTKTKQHQKQTNKYKN